ncbi:haloacid dehalogenase type II [Roseovarius aestuarii]|nr:haloacid dehalogenase type II [Roseovarius aestuarii]
MAITTCIFDAYGTLFDVAAAARIAADEPGREAFSACWPMIAEHWRAKQLQYTWHRTITHDYVSFWEVTEHALDWALEAEGMDNDPALRARLLQLYRELQAYVEVPATLRTLKDAGLTTAILSNGSLDMLNTAVQSAGVGDLLDDVLSVDGLRRFKPARAVYDLVGQRFSCPPDEVLFVSSNGWDAAGAAGYGFHTVWINRAGAPMDRLPASPGHVLTDLNGVAELTRTI